MLRKAGLAVPGREAVSVVGLVGGLVGLVRLPSLTPSVRAAATASRMASGRPRSSDSAMAERPVSSRARAASAVHLGQEQRPVVILASPPPARETPRHGRHTSRVYRHT